MGQWATKKIEEQLESRECDKCKKVLDETTGVFKFVEKDGSCQGQLCRKCKADGSVSVTDRLENAYDTLSAKAKVAGKSINDKWTEFNRCECDGADEDCKICNGKGYISVTERLENAYDTLSAKAKVAGKFIEEQLASYECTKGSNCKDKNCKCGGTGHVKRLSHRVRHKANKMYGQAGKTLSEAYG